MFGKKIDNDKKPKNETSSLEAIASSAFTKSAAPINIDDFPVHTMKEDFNLDGPVKASFITKKPVEEDAVPKPKKTSNTGKIVALIIILLIIMIVAAAGYYFWMTRVKSPIATAPDTNLPTQDIPEVTPPTQNSFSTTQANYLSLDFQNIDAVGLEATLKTTSDKIAQMKTTGPIEFILTDSLNNPISLQAFAQKIGLSLPQSTISLLDSNFTLYVYIDNSTEHLGLSTTTKDNAALQKALSQEETTLVADMNPLFLGAAPSTIIASPFASSTYDNAAIRYSNLTPTSKLLL